MGERWVQYNFYLLSDGCGGASLRHGAGLVVLFWGFAAL